MTKDMTDEAYRATAITNMIVVLCRNASLQPADVASIFSRILLSTCINDDQATTVMAETKLEEGYGEEYVNGSYIFVETNLGK